ncbi:CDC27 family protein [candidate division KSB1 bacterium]|nr:CDC27 family protein [candidate division KSB1 bacterium]
MITPEVWQSRRLLLGPCTVAMFLFIPTVAAVAQNHETRDGLLQSTLEQFHHERYDSALAGCAKLRGFWPEDPSGYVLAASIYQTRMRQYRVRLFEAQFDSFSAQAVKLAEQQVRRQATAEKLFMLGTARGNQAMHRFHRGEWGGALKDAVVALHAMKRARQSDPDFVDPSMALALYEYWKSRKLGLGLGLLGDKRQSAVQTLEEVRARGRYSSVDAAYSLQDIHLHDGEYQRALEINAWLHERFPEHPSVLYHRALLLEKLQRHQEAMAAWEALSGRLEASQLPSYGYLAECHLHRAKLYEITNDPTATGKIVAALKAAEANAGKHDKTVELEGPFESVEQIRRTIGQMLKKYSDAGVQFSAAQRP